MTCRTLNVSLSQTQYFGVRSAGKFLLNLALRFERVSPRQKGTAARRTSGAPPFATRLQSASAIRHSNGDRITLHAQIALVYPPASPEADAFPKLFLSLSVEERGFGCSMPGCCLSGPRANDRVSANRRIAASDAKRSHVGSDPYSSMFRQRIAPAPRLVFRPRRFRQRVVALQRAPFEKP